MSSSLEPRLDIVTEELENDCWVVSLVGEHDLSTRDKLDSVLADVLATGATVIVDLSAATFIDSSTLAVLIHAFQQADPAEHFAVVAPAGSLVARLFALTGMDQLPLRRYETRSAALVDAQEL
jgi:anti-sigma B factor antagonist